MPVAQLKPDHVTRILDAHDADWSASNKHGFARCVRHAFRWAADEGLIGRSPLIGLTKPEAESCDVVISAAEYEAILGVATEPNLRELIVAWETRARPRELITVEAGHVQADRGRWVFPKKQAKGKRLPRAVYLTEVAMEITRRRMEAHPDGPLFRNSDGEPWHRWSVNCAFIRLCTALGKKAMVVEQLPRFRKARVAAGAGQGNLVRAVIKATEVLIDKP